MHEICYCGWFGDILEREPVRDARGGWAFRCLACGHLDDLRWLPDDARRTLLDMARQRYPAATGEPAASVTV